MPTKSLSSPVTFKADVQQNDGTFDGVMDTVTYDADTNSLSFVDGATGKRHAIDVRTADKAGNIAYSRMDFNADGAADPFALGRKDDGTYYLISDKKGFDGRTGTPQIPLNGDLGQVVLRDYPKAEMGDWGFDLSHMDRSVDPGDDFYMYANGNWQETTEILPTRFGAGVMSDIYYKTNADVSALVAELINGDHPNGSNAQKIRDFYTSFMDMDQINAAGLTPYQDDLDFIAGLETRDDLITAFSQAGHRGYSAPMDFGVWTDSKNPDKRAIYVGFGGLIQGRGSRDYYLKEEHAPIRDAFKNFTAYALEYSGKYTKEEAADYAQKILDVEIGLAELTWPNEDYRDPEALYNPVTMDELKAKAPNYDWENLLTRSGLPVKDRFVAAELKDFDKMADFIESVPVDVWKAHLTFQMLNGSVSLLPQDFQDARHNLYIKPKYGRDEQTPREQMATGNLNSELGEAIGRYYVEKHFPASSKTQLEGLVENLRAAYQQTFDDNTWLSDPTKAAAMNKLDLLWSEVGYPSEDNWKDYSEIEIKPGDAAGNARRLREHAMKEGLEKLDEPVDRGEWLSPPQEVNAHFIPTRNKTVFMAGYLQSPNFDPNADPAVNYGAIGSTIGHEMGHAFDDMGSQFDEKGALRNWWTEEDRTVFMERVSGLVEQFNQYEPIPGMFVNGELTLGENIGDLVGLYIAHQAYKISLNGEEPPVINGMTGDERFFLSFAQSHRSKSREATLRNQIMTDPHSPDKLRANGILRNFDAWYDTYDVEQSDDLYLPSDDRVRVWWDE